MKHPVPSPVLAVAIAAGCTAGNANISAQECECRLVGHYHQDSRNFCSVRFNSKTIGLYMTALEESVKPEATASPLSFEERLAVNYDAYWAISKAIGVKPAGLGAILFMVGCEEESFIDKYRFAPLRDPAGWWGELGVAEHIIGNYEESEGAFDKALQIEPDYFAKRPIQKRIAEAARARRPLTP